MITVPYDLPIMVPHHYLNGNTSQKWCHEFRDDVLHINLIHSSSSSRFLYDRHAMMFEVTYIRAYTGFSIFFRFFKL